MDIAVSLPQPKVVLDCYVFGGKGFGCAFLGKSRTILKAHFSGMNKIGTSRGNSRVLCIVEELSLDYSKEAEIEVEKLNNVAQTKKQGTRKYLTRDNSPFVPETSLKSSPFFPVSFFSFSADETDNTPTSIFHGLVESAKKQLPKLVMGLLLIGAGHQLGRNEFKNQGIG